MIIYIEILCAEMNHLGKKSEFKFRLHANSLASGKLLSHCEPLTAISPVFANLSL